MDKLEREYIAVGCNDDTEHIIPMIRMSGTGGRRKTIRGIHNISKLVVYHLDFNSQGLEMIGTIPWDKDMPSSDVVIDYDPVAYQGTVLIVATGDKWNYSVDKYAHLLQPGAAPGYKDIPDHKEKIRKPESKAIVDKDKVRELEAEGSKVKILWPDELAQELEKDIFGQDEGIKEISELIASNLRRENSEINVIVIFGPTGVGKTEVARLLPGALTKLTGIEYGFKQIALNEYTEESSFARFVGSAAGYIGYKDPTVFEDARKNPYMVFCLDELEKATPKIFTGLMETFSTGMIHMADNSPDIDLRHSILIATSNIPVDMGAYNATESIFEKKELCRNTLAKFCGHPEIAGKISNCLAFQALSSEAVTDIVAKIVVQELRNEDMEVVCIDPHLMVELKQMNNNYGARGIRDAVREGLKYLAYDRNIMRYHGKRVSLSGSREHIEITIIEAPGKPDDRTDAA